MSDTHVGPTEAFAALDMRIGTVRSARPHPGTHKPAYQLEIDFGPEIGIKRSSARIAENYKLSDLPGRQVVGVVNLPPKRIAGFVSECLVTGFTDRVGHVVLCAPDRPVPDGGRLH